MVVIVSAAIGAFVLFQQHDHIARRNSQAHCIVAWDKAGRPAPKDAWWANDPVDKKSENYFDRFDDLNASLIGCAGPILEVSLADARQRAADPSSGRARLCTTRYNG